MYRTLLICGLASLVSSLPAAFDNVNVDALLAKPEVVDAYVDCLLENAACTESGLRLRAITPNALTEKCSQCSAFQLESVQKISKAISIKKPAEWAKILDKYDPQSLHRSDIESLINKPAEAKPAEAKPAEAKPAEAKPAEAKPAEPAKPEDAPKPAEIEKPAEPAKIENSPKSAAKLEEPAKLAEPLKPAEPAKLEEPAKPELAKPAGLAKPAELEKPAEQAKPADLAKKP